MRSIWQRSRVLPGQRNIKLCRSKSITQRALSTSSFKSNQENASPKDVFGSKPSGQSWASLEDVKTSTSSKCLVVEVKGNSNRSERYSPLFLRDSCKCTRCVDPNSTQKNFDTCQIPNDVEIESLDTRQQGLYIKWKNDIPGYDGHVGYVPRKLLAEQSSPTTIKESHHSAGGPLLWGKKDAESLPRILYNRYMEDDQSLLQAVKQLRDYGFLLIKQVPEDEKSVEKLANRIGIIRNSFYGQTWDVKSKKAATNVAYTKQYLGLHMDLLYMNEPPGYQLLHCLKNESSGGDALFSDSISALLSLEKDQVGALAQLKINFKYDNDGHQYSRTASFIELQESNKAISSENIRVINHSPPFQGPLPIELRRKSKAELDVLMNAWKAFTEASESPKLLFEYRYEAGDCVIFNNRRVLHGRREFDPESGERWLKGCYVDSDVFNSRMRVLHDQLEPWIPSFETENVNSE